MIKCFIPLLLLFGTASAQKTIRVSQDGKGDYKTVQEAFNHVPVHAKSYTVVQVASGIYREKLVLTEGKWVHLEGAGAFETVLVYDDHPGKQDAAGRPVNTMTSQSFLLSAANFRARDIQFRNDAGFSAGQAVAIRIDGDLAAFYHCRFTGFQDVLFASMPGTRQYYEDCYIEGTTDFIFGPSRAWFQNCHIHSLKNSFVTAAATPADQDFGYVFNECTLTADSSLHAVYLGRPWRPYASVIYLHCYMDRHILAAGWENWRNPENEKTARYAEYASYGPGADSSRRVSWSHQLTAVEAAAVRPQKVLNGWTATPLSVQPLH